MKKLIPLLVLVLASVLHAEPVKLSNRHADELLATLKQIGPGTVAVNTTKIARNINALLPFVEAYAKGNQDAVANHKITPTTKLDDPAVLAVNAEIEKNSAETITVDLQFLTFSDDELNSPTTKINGAIYSVVLRYLTAPPAESAKK